LAGDLDYASGIAPWIAWGPYLWADGLNPRSDGLMWEQSDLGADGTHPSVSGREKVGAMLLDFMLASPFSQPWFLSPTASDFNSDGVIDAGDLAAWIGGFGTSGAATHMQGDADGDLDVDGADFLTWQRQLRIATTGVAAVPEPATVVLLVSAELAMFLRLRMAVS
jgi:hypothetical protein